MEYHKQIGEYELSHEIFISSWGRGGFVDYKSTFYKGNEKIKRQDLPKEIQVEFEAFEDECQKLWDESEERYG